MFERRQEEIRARRLEIRALLENDAAADLDALTTELGELETEYAQNERRIETLRGLNDGTVTANRSHVQNPVAEGLATTQDRDPAISHRAESLAYLQGINATEAENRATEFVRGGTMRIPTDRLERSILIASGGIAAPTRVSGITPAQNNVSGIIDLVNVVNAEGMAQDDVSYTIANANAAVNTDGTAANQSDPTFGIASIKPTLVNTISYISKHIERVTPLNYQERVSFSAMNALRQKMARMIVNGDPAATPIAEMCGIINAPAEIGRAHV